MEDLNSTGRPAVPICWAEAVAGVHQYLKYCLSVIWNTCVFKETIEGGFSILKISWPPDAIMVTCVSMPASSLMLTAQRKPWLL